MYYYGSLMVPGYNRAAYETRQRWSEVSKLEEGMRVKKMGKIRSGLNNHSQEWWGAFSKKKKKIMGKILPVSVSVGGVCRYEDRCMIETEAGSRGVLLNFYLKLSHFISSHQCIKFEF